MNAYGMPPTGPPPGFFPPEGCGYMVSVLLRRISYFYQLNITMIASKKISAENISNGPTVAIALSFFEEILYVFYFVFCLYGSHLQVNIS